MKSGAPAVDADAAKAAVHKAIVDAQAQADWRWPPWHACTTLVIHAAGVVVHWLHNHVDIINVHKYEVL